MLAAMLTLTLVATLAAGAAAQQWRGVETERADRERGQAAWLQWGAMDWIRIILREDARKGGSDDLSEVWAVPLKELRLSDFLTSGASGAVLLADQSIDNVFLSGQAQDMQARLNVFNLVQSGQVNTDTLAIFTKLFDLQGLDVAELEAMKDNLRFAQATAPTDPAGASAVLLPERLEELTLMGLSSGSLERLRPFITWLPKRTPININTASAEVLYASLPAMDLDTARKIISARQNNPFATFADVDKAVPALAGQFGAGYHSTTTNFFEVTSRLRFAEGARSTVMIERSVVERNGLNVVVLWRERGSFPVAQGGKTVEEITGALR